MLKETYVSFDTAKCLLEVGFPQDFATFYDKDGNFIDGFIDTKRDSDIAAPSQAVAMKWFRDEFNINVYPFNVNDNGGRNCFMDGKYWRLISNEHYIINMENTMYATYEEAAEAGIQLACIAYLTHQKNLEEFVKCERSKGNYDLDEHTRKLQEKYKVD